MRLSPIEINALFQRLAFPGLDVTPGEKLTPCAHGMRAVFIPL